jgi:hypothetical protein
VCDSANAIKSTEQLPPPVYLPSFQSYIVDRSMNRPSNNHIMISNEHKHQVDVILLQTINSNLWHYGVPTVRAMQTHLQHVAEQHIENRLLIVLDVRPLISRKFLTMTSGAQH